MKLPFLIALGMRERIALVTAHSGRLWLLSCNEGVEGPWLMHI